MKLLFVLCCARGGMALRLAAPKRCAPRMMAGGGLGGGAAGTAAGGGGDISGGGDSERNAQLAALRKSECAKALSPTFELT